MDVIPTGNASDLDATEDKNEDISIGLLFASKAIVQLIGTGQTPVNFGQLRSTPVKYFRPINYRLNSRPVKSQYSNGYIH